MRIATYKSPLTWMGMMHDLPSISVLDARELMESMPALVMDALGPIEAEPLLAMTAEALGPREDMPRATMLPVVRWLHILAWPLLEAVPKTALSEPLKADDAVPLNAADAELQQSTELVCLSWTRGTALNRITGASTREGQSQCVGIQTQF
jgi:hypothetical protein